MLPLALMGKTNKQTLWRFLWRPHKPSSNHRLVDNQHVHLFLHVMCDYGCRCWGFLCTSISMWWGTVDVEVGVFCAPMVYCGYRGWGFLCTSVPTWWGTVDAVVGVSGCETARINLPNFQEEWPPRLWEHYRHVSLASVSCILHEHIICIHLLNHTWNHDVLTTLSHGFRSRSFTETQITEALHDLLGTLMKLHKQT